MIIAVTGMGLCSALGEDATELVAAIDAGRTGLLPHAPLANLPPGDLAGIVSGPNMRPWLRRRKDRKLMARASELALAAAGAALGDWPGDRCDLAIYLGVGREPPDDGESEGALAASCRDGALDEALLAGPGRDRYPPLLPLKTLPNMALAHISINLGVCGENNAWAGDGDAGLRAVVSGVRAVAEGRAPAALVGGADSLVDLGSARDRLRVLPRPTTAPGEAAAVLLLEPLDAAQARGAHIHALIDVPDAADPMSAQSLGVHDFQALLGDCGAADGALSTLIAVVRAATCATDQRVVSAHPRGATAQVRVRAVSAC